jgi:hypothetical protein
MRKGLFFEMYCALPLSLYLISGRNQRLQLGFVVEKKKLGETPLCIRSREVLSPNVCLSSTPIDAYFV